MSDEQSIQTGRKDDRPMTTQTEKLLRDLAANLQGSRPAEAAAVRFAFDEVKRLGAVVAEERSKRRELETALMNETQRVAMAIEQKFEGDENSILSVGETELVKKIVEWVFDGAKLEAVDVVSLPPYEA